MTLAELIANQKKLQRLIELEDRRLRRQQERLWKALQRACEKGVKG